ncbi:putative RNA-directed DNA polymerase [Tanacetum coccineum]
MCYKVRVSIVTSDCLLRTWLIHSRHRRAIIARRAGDDSLLLVGSVIPDAVVLGSCFCCAGCGLDLLILVIAWSACSVTPLKLSSLFVLIVCFPVGLPYRETQPFLAEQWERCKFVVLTWILNCVSPELFIGQVFSSNAKQMWDELSETYDKIDGSLNSLWREYDAMVQLPICTCNGADSYKDHVQLLKLMQLFPSRDESHRTMHAGGSSVKGSISAFNSRPYDNKGNNTSFVPRSGDNKKKFNNSNDRNPNLLCKNCNMIGHTIERCFELIGYPPNFKKRSVSSQNVMSNSSVNDKDTVTGASTSHTLNSEQYHRLMSLLSDSGSGTGVQNNVAGSHAKSSFVFSFLSCRFFNKHRNISTYSAFVGWIIDLGVSQHITFTIEFLFNVIDVSHLNITVAHTNGIIAKVNQIGSYKLNDKIVLKDVLVVPGYQVSLLSVHQLAKVNKMLGHPSDQVLSVLEDKIDLNGFESSKPCEVCHRAKQTRDPFILNKFASRNEKCVLIGYSFNKKRYKLLSEPYYDERDPSDSGGTKSSPVGHVVESASADPNSTSDPSSSPDKLGSIIAEGGTGDDSATLNDDDLISKGEGLDLYNFDLLFHENSNENRTDEGQSVRRSSRKSVLPSKLKDYVVDGKVKYGINTVINYSNLSCENFSFTTNLNKTYDLKSYKEVVLDSKWVEAMNNEIEALNRNKTWTIVELPKGRKPIGCKWVWKIKYKSTGEVERYKARLVAKGFGQKEGIDYEETFSPVVKMVTVRCVLTLGVHYDWNVYQLDINNALLYGELIEDVYMTLPEGYFSSDDKRVCKLQKSLYGLKQAPRKWNEKLTFVLSEFGFQQSKNDFFLYTLFKGQSFVVLLVYVDDILITGNDISDIKMCKDLLCSKFLIKDLGDLKYFLGIELIKNDKGICLSQRKYSLELLSEFGMLDCKPSKTHLPDISYVVHRLCQVMHAPRLADMKSAFKVLRYIKSSPGGTDWAKCTATRKSSAEAEYRAMSSVTCEIIWILKILTELKVEYKTPVDMFCDNSPAIQIAANPVFHERTKHFEIDIFFLREKISEDHKRFCGLLHLKDMFQA